MVVGTYLPFGQGFGDVKYRLGYHYYGAVNVWNIILARTYFQGIPDELVEAAVIDRANEFQIFWKIMLPLAKPIMFVLFLYAFVGQWEFLTLMP